MVNNGTAYDDDWLNQDRFHSALVPQVIQRFLTS